MSYEKISNFFKCHRRNQRKSLSDIVSDCLGGTRKGGNEPHPSVQQLSRETQLRYELSNKDMYINSLEMENELMWDFLLLAGRK